MEKDLIFFGEGGFTSTKANYVANIAKETYRLLEKSLENVDFTSQSVELIDVSGTKKVITKGCDQEFLESIEDKLIYIANLKALIAWLREGIRAKKRLIDEAQEMSDEKAYEMLGITAPTMPKRGTVPSSDDIAAQFDIEKRNRMIYLNTVCAQIGSYIHEDGYYANKREELADVISNPVRIVNSGNGTLVYTTEPAVSPEIVEKVYFELQEKYREYQAELNVINHEIESAIQESEREIDARYRKEINEYNSIMRDIKAKVTAYIHSEVSKAQALKIILPEALTGIYQSLNLKD
ncbi:MAG: hypothetical protein K6A98_02535 [Prevotella sp.]|nr:hypothetical protein [Prevotella sp.]